MAVERPTHTIAVEIRGRTYEGSFHVTEGVVVVRTSGAEKFAVLGEFSAEVLARQLLREIVLQRARGNER